MRRIVGILRIQCCRTVITHAMCCTTKIIKQRQLHHDGCQLCMLTHVCGTLARHTTVWLLKARA